MELLTPNLGLFIWSLVIFLGLFFILRKMAWGPILDALNEREVSISNSLEEAAKAREEMSKLTAENEALLKEARQEKDKILKEANAMKDQIIADAKKAAADAAAVERDKAKAQIDAEKNAALAEIKQTAAALAVEVSEQILRKELSDKKAQSAFAEKLITELSSN